eukprot:TRINITY_DN0_c77_g1_i1.p1 TRINITY_DN0_c77_g1~~TRINITY_DN0_c77_g1_i1.p1  ORF type:complete len:235 (+),score=25.34 TRINITY_DN0_c77_g1_i1:59-763(+)
MQGSYRRISNLPSAKESSSYQGSYGRPSTGFQPGPAYHRGYQSASMNFGSLSRRRPDDNDMLPITTDNICCILEPTEDMGGLFLGNMVAAQDFKLMAQYQIGAVLSIAQETRISYPYSLVTAHKVVFAFDDDAFDLTRHFQECIDFINENRRRGVSVFVHCMAGISRSSTIVLAYLMHSEGYSLRDAMNHCVTRRPIVKPNPGFYHQLQRYEQQLGSRKPMSRFLDAFHVNLCF